MTIILSFIVIGFVLYSRCLRGTVLLDDAFIFAMKQYMIQGNLKMAWRNPWRRLLILSYALNGKFGGQDTYPFHVTNVCIHILNSLLLVPLFNALGFTETWSLIGAMAYLVHPQCVAAAAYISGRSSLLSGFFVILSILSVLHGWPILALPLMACALHSKEDTAACFLLLAYLSGGWWALAFLAVPVGAYVKKRKETYMIRSTHAMKQPDYSYTAISEYLVRVPLWIVGSWLNNKPHIPLATKWTALVAMFNIAAFAFSIALAPPVWITCLALTFLSPMLIYLVVPLEDPLMDYRNYLGMIGGIGLLLTLLQFAPYWIGGALIVYLFVKAWPRVGRFRTPITFWVGCMKDGSEESPYVLTQLATSFHMMMDLKSAEHYNKKALELDPTINQAWNNLATIYNQQDKVTECVDTLERWTVACPKQKKSWEKLRAAYVQLKDEVNVARCDAMLAIL